jgi:hypothetical protein
LDLKHTSIGSFLNGMSRCVGKEERVVRETKEQRYFFHDLENGVLDWGSVRVRKWVEIEGDNRDAVGELL